MNAAEYKRKWGYNKGTALMSVNLSNRASATRKRRKILPPPETREHLARAKAA